MQKQSRLSMLQSTVACLIFIVLFSFCSDEQVLTTASERADDSLATKAANISAISCSSCKYVIPATASIVDGKALGIKPGDVICFSSSIKYTTSVTFRNIVGTSDLPVIVTNCGGPVVLTVTSKPINVKFSYSKYFRFTGGNVDNSYGIKMSGSSSNGLVLCDLTTNVEVDHVEISNVGFAGIMAKTDPTCDDATNRGSFTMRNVSIHHNYIHHTGGEGMYIGHNFYGGYTLSCGVKYPHLIDGLKVYKNKVRYAGWDGIQVSSAPKNVSIYQNTVENFGTAMKSDQQYGIMLGSGTGGRCYSNYIRGGTGTSLTVFGMGDNIIYNNVIVNSANTGIFCDERTDTFGAGYMVFNNTIINPKQVGIRMYGEKVPKNVVLNNIVVNPGAYSTMGNNAYIMKLSSVTRIEIANNYLTRSLSELKFVDPSTNNYRLTSASPAVNKGKSISTYNVTTDFYNGSRLKGSAYDIGADEY